jgi:glycosyltransferase involved in cell wall biosynthesis
MGEPYLSFSLHSGDGRVRKVALFGPHRRWPGGVNAHLAALEEPLGRRVSLSRVESGRASAWSWPRRGAVDDVDLWHLNPSLRWRAWVRDVWWSRGVAQRVLQIHGWDPAVSRWMRRVGPNVLGAAHLVLLTQRFRDEARGWGVPEERLWVVGPCARAWDLPPRDSEGPRLFVGRLDKNKGVDRLIRMVDRELWVVGDGPERARLERVASGRPVRFFGMVHDVAPLLAASSALVMASEREGLPVAALEALGSGRPVVATAVGGLPELPLATARFGDEDGFRSALAHVSDVSPSTQADIRRRFSPDAVADQLVAVYERVLESA